MTTSVNIAASCGSDTEVVIHITDKERGEDIEEVLESGETAQHVVYDGRQITVRERSK